MGSGKGSRLPFRRACLGSAGGMCEMRDVWVDELTAKEARLVS